jgi:hypothetical protein
MTKFFYILDDPDLPTFYPDRYFVEKFASGFALNGFKVRVAKSVGKIKENSMVMIYKHGLLVKNIFSPLKTSKGESFIKKLRRERIVGFLGNLISNPGLLRFYFRSSTRNYERAVNVLRKLSEIKGVVVICWTYFKYRDLLEELSMNYILSGPYYYDKPPVGAPMEAEEWYRICKTDKRALPIKFAAAADPDKIGENCCNRDIKVCYVGNRSYGPEYYELFINRPDCRIILTPPYIPEEERINIYRNSMISLGLHKKTITVTERIFESLAYGALCFSNHRLAAEVTGGIVKFIKDRNHLLQLVEHYVNNEEERLELREKGFKFIKDGHTYKHEAQKFIDLANKLYGFDLPGGTK